MGYANETMDELAELVQQAQSGDDDAYAALVRTYIDAVYSFTFRLLGNAEDASDATQETFLKAWRSIRRFNSERPLKPWLFAIAKNAAMDQIRKRKAITFSFLDTDESSFADTIPDAMPLPEELFATKELDTKVAEAIEKLPERDRMIITLRYEQNFPFDDIGAIMQLKPATVRSIHHRALARLRDLLVEPAP